MAIHVAKKRGVEPGAAADQLDRVVTRIIRTLRRGEHAHLPGLGTISPGNPWTFHQEQGKPADGGSPAPVITTTITTTTIMKGEEPNEH